MSRTSTEPDATGADERFASEVVPHIDVMYRVARAIAGNPTDAEDLVQDALLRAYRSIETFDGRYPRAWLMTIVRNAQINRVRRKRPSLLSDPDVIEHLTPMERVDRRSAEDVVVEPQFDAAVDAALQSLSNDAAEVVQLVDIEGLTYKEAAELLGVPAGTVMSRLHRARHRIREALTDTDVQPRSDRQ